MKVDKDFKDEVNSVMSDASYVGRKILTKAVIIILILSIGGAIIGVGFKLFQVNADRKIFKQSVVYNEGVLDDLAKYRFEMQSTSDEVEKTAIAELVNSRFANYDEDKIENDDLKEFLEDCRNGNY